MPYIMENLVQYDVSESEADTLLKMGFVVKAEDSEDQLDTTALVWDELGLEGERAFDLFDAVLIRGEQI